MSTITRPTPTWQPPIDKPQPAGPVASHVLSAGAIKSLCKELTQHLDGEVRFDRGSIALYATDSSNFRQAPLGVVVPRTIDDVVATHQICSRYGAPILNRGGGTSLSGETVNFAVVIDHSKYLRRIAEPDVERRLVTVEPGAVNQKVNETTGKMGLIFGPDPSSHGYCTIGGNVGNNSCGVHSVQSHLFGPGPRTSDNTYAMEIVTYEGDRFRVGVNEEPQLAAIIAAGGRKGEIYARLRDLRDRYADLIRRRFPPVDKLPRRVSGYNLDELLPERGFNVARALVGTESTCATALEITLMLTPALLDRVTVVVAYDALADAAEHIPEIMEWKPIGLEGLDDVLFEEERAQHVHPEALHLLPGTGATGWLMVEFGADTADEVHQKGEQFVRWLIDTKRHRPDRVRLTEGRETKSLWEVREAGLGATAFPPGEPDHWPGWEDSAVPPERVGPYLRDLKQLYAKHGMRGAMYGHLGQGCVHSRISFDLRHADGIRRYRAFLDEAADLVVSYGGSLSGEHGDGQQRAAFLEKQYGPELVEAMRQFKRIWDPQGKMNPGKVIDPYPVDAYLKLGTDYNPPRPEVKFAYREDGGDFAHATLRCVGVGKCRQPGGVDVMCPSYIVTKEEKHTTRGRARLLFEMLQGDIIRDGWKSREVREALDLCLACKGCTKDCPVHVDMPTLKAEFLYHYYQGPRHHRNRHMYAFGFIDQAARLASLFPEAANFLTHAPGLAQLAKFAAGMDQHREIPRFAPLTLQAWFRRRGGSAVVDGPRVILWPDCFNNHFHTQVGVACVEALEAAGFRVLMPDVHVCCGRPLYDYGFLDAAERYLRRNLRVLRAEIRNGTPLVGMEPSCLAVFRDEMPKLLPHDDDAERLVRNCFHWAEFFQKHEIALPKLEAKALVWGHCHQKATGGIESEVALLRGMGIEVQEAKGGCCGQAGAWGFENGRHEMSLECAEVGFLPAIREADPATLIVADGFSCKTQLEQANVGRKALHTAEVMKLARDLTVAKVSAAHPERRAASQPSAPASVRWARLGATAALSGAALAAMYWLAKRARS